MNKDLNEVAKTVVVVGLLFHKNKNIYNNI